MIADAVAAPVIRQATTTDTDAILRVLVELAQTSRYTGGAVLNRSHLAEMLSRMLANPDAGFVLATVDHEVVGVLVLLLVGAGRAGERQPVLQFADRLPGFPCSYLCTG